MVVLFISMLDNIASWVSVRMVVLLRVLEAGVWLAWFAFLAVWAARGLDLGLGLEGLGSGLVGLGGLS